VQAESLIHHVTSVFTGESLDTSHGQTLQRKHVYCRMVTFPLNVIGKFKIW